MGAIADARETAENAKAFTKDFPKALEIVEMSAISIAISVACIAAICAIGLLIQLERE